MRQVNVRLLLILVAVVVGGITGVYFLHRFQVDRNAGTFVTQARQRIVDGRDLDAINLFARYVNLRPNDNEAYAEFAQIVLKRAESPDATRNDVARAYATLETAVRKNPTNALLRQKLAVFQMRIGRFGDAREHLQVLVGQLAPDSGATDKEENKENNETDDAGQLLTLSQLDVLLARSWAGTNNFEEAGRIASRLIGFDLSTKAFDPKHTFPPNSTEVFIILAAILEEKSNDSAAATRVLDQLVQANATDPKAWLALARWHRQHGDLKGASQDVARASQLAPDDPETMLTAFEIALTEKNFAQAGKIIKQGMKLFPDDERMVRGTAVLAMQEQQPARAIEVLQEAVQKMPNRAALLLLLADVLLQQNRVEEVELTIGKLKEALGAANPSVGLLEARVLVSQQRWQEAKQKLNLVRPLVAGSDDLTRQVDLYLGQCFEQLGQFDEQLEANRRVLSEDPSSLAARVGAASALVASGKADESLNEFESVAAALGPDRLTSIPQVWSPLLQLRVAAQMKRTDADRDWSAIDDLLDILQQSVHVSAPQIALLRADVLVRKGESDSAVDLLTTAAATTPDEPQLWTALVTLALREKDLTAARTQLAGVPSDVANTPSLLLIEAQLAAREPAETASKQLSSIEERSEQLPAAQASRVLSGLAAIRMSMGQRADADRLWTALLKKSPDDLRVRTALFELAREEGDIKKAQAYAADISRLAGPTSPQARVAQASVLTLGVRVSQKKKAVPNQTTLDLSDEDRINLDEARNLLIEAENERGGWYQIQQLFAEIDGLRGDIPGAIEHLQKAVGMGPANPSVVRQLVALLYATNRLQDAQEAVAMLGPDGLEDFGRISAEMEMRSGKFDEAVTSAERSVSVDSTNAGDLLWLGQLLSRSGKPDRAGNVLERAVKMAPDQPETWLTLLSHELATGKRKLAEQTLQRAVSTLTEPDRQLVAAQGNEMLGQFEEAEKNYRDAVAIAPENLAIARGMAAFFIRRGKLNPARETLQKIVAAQSNGPELRSTKTWARRTLAELTAEKGGYKSLTEALAIIEQNADSTGKLAPEDVTLEVSLMAGRPEPASWRRAIRLLESLAREQPLSTSQRLQLAQLREKTGRWEECRNDMVSLVAASNTPPALYAVLIEKLIAHGELSTAKVWIVKLKSSLPGAPITLALEARLAIAENDRGTAVAAAKKLLPSGPVPLEQVGQLKAIAKLMEDLGFPKAADKVLIEFATRSPEGIVARAEFLGRQKRVDEALNLLEKAWDRLPLERILQASLVVARSQGVQPSPEVTVRLDQWFTKARREDPDSIVLPLLLAELRELQGNNVEVESLYRNLLARKGLASTQAAIVANNLAFYLAKPDTSDEANRLIDGAILELGPHPDLLDTRGIVRLVSGNTPGAIEDLTEAILDPSAVKYLHLALAHVEAKQIESAKRSLAEAKKLGLNASQLSPSDRERLKRIDAAVAAPL